MALCKICQSGSNILFQKMILGKYPSNYYRCSTCGFMQTDTPVWIEEAYSTAITTLDIGLVDRNLHLRDQISRIIDDCLPASKRMLDYGGGYGLFVRMMRDRGYDFYRQDAFCENIFAKHFDLSDLTDHQFDVLTSFEVFEHFENPMQEIEKMIMFSPTIIFSTLLLPPDDDALEDWWYISEETGQHLAFYSYRTLEFIAKKFNRNLYSNRHNLHVLTEKSLSQNRVERAMSWHPTAPILQRVLRKFGWISDQRPSLTQTDYESIKAKLRQGMP